MKKNFSIFFLISVIVISIFFISAGKKTIAEECNDCDPISTEPGDADYCKINPLKLTPGISDEIECGIPVIIKITGGKGPFIWQVFGNGYTLSEISKTEYSLSCIKDCACGDGSGQAGAIATVTVTDSCSPKNEVTKTIRNKSGAWKEDDYGGNDSNIFYICRDRIPDCYADPSGIDYEYIVGNKKWEITKRGYNWPDDPQWYMRSENRNDWNQVPLSKWPPCGGPRECGRILFSGPWCVADNCTSYCALSHFRFYFWGCPQK